MAQKYFMPIVKQYQIIQLKIYNKVVKSAILVPIRLTLSLLGDGFTKKSMILSLPGTFTLPALAIKKYQPRYGMKIRPRINIITINITTLFN